MTLLFGTSNQAKLAYMKKRLSSLRIRIIGLCEMDRRPPEVDETGNSPLINARLKAQAYYDFYRTPLFSCDSGLYLAGLPAEQQPGVHVRHVGGRRLSDEEMIDYYGGLARRYGDLTARYRNAVCLILSDHERFESMADDLSDRPFILTGTPHPRREAGFPLDSLSLDMETGSYYYDLQNRSSDESASDDGVVRFFRQSLANRSDAL